MVSQARRAWGPVELRFACLDRCLGCHWCRGGGLGYGPYRILIELCSSTAISHSGFSIEGRRGIVLAFSGSGAPGLKRAPIASGFPLKKGICNPNRPPGGKSRYHGCPFQTWCVGGHNNYPKGDRMLQKPSKSHISLNSTSWTSSLGWMESSQRPLSILR